MGNLPKAPGYNFVDTNLGRVFSRDRLYNMDTITDSQIERLIEKNPKYWGAKFERVQVKAKATRKAETEDTAKTEESSEV